MARFYPDRYLAQVLPGDFEEKGLLFDNLHPRKMYLRALYRAAGKEGKALEATVYDTIRNYQEKEKALKAAGVADYAEQAVNNQALLKNRVENFLVWNKVQEEKAAHSGQYYRWLPCDAEHPDPEHQLLYGKVFSVGTGDKDGNMPGERYGCRCGIEWLSEEENPEKKVLENTKGTLVEQINVLYANAFSGRRLKDVLTDVNVGVIPAKTAYKIKRATGITVKRFKNVIKAENLRHGINRHAHDKEVPITADKVALIPHIVNKFDRVKLETRKNGNLRLAFTKKLKNTYTYVATVGKKNKWLLFKTFFGKK